MAKTLRLRVSQEFLDAAGGRGGVEEQIRRALAFLEKARVEQAAGNRIVVLQSETGEDGSVVWNPKKRLIVP